jgi:hypothetical protein
LVGMLKPLRRGQLLCYSNLKKEKRLLRRR